MQWISTIKLNKYAIKRYCGKRSNTNKCVLFQALISISFLLVKDTLFIVINYAAICDKQSSATGLTYTFELSSLSEVDGHEFLMWQFEYFESFNMSAVIRDIHL